MLIEETKKLKLNSKNIHSFLVTSNRKIKKLRVDENNFFKRIQDERKKKAKERSIERVSDTKKDKKIRKGLIGKTMSIYDKIKEFFGLLLFGILLKGLPGIIRGTKEFLEENKWIVDSVKIFFKVIGGAVWAMKGIYDFFTGSGVTKAQLANERTQIDRKLPQFKKDVNSITGGIDNFNTDDNDDNDEEDQNEESNPISNFFNEYILGLPSNKEIKEAQRIREDRNDENKDLDVKELSNIEFPDGLSPITRSNWNEFKKYLPANVVKSLEKSSQFSYSHHFKDEVLFDAKGTSMLWKDILPKEESNTNTSFEGASLLNKELLVASSDISSVLSGLNFSEPSGDSNDGDNSSKPLTSMNAMKVFDESTLVAQDNNLKLNNSLESLQNALDTLPSINKETVNGNAIFGETDGGTGRVENAPGWVHGHFQTNDGTAEDVVNDVAPIVKKLIDRGVPTELSGGQKFTKDMNMQEIKEMIRLGVSQHRHSGDGRSVDIFVPEGTRVPVPLSDVKAYGGAEGVSGILPGTGKVWVGHLTPDSKSGSSDNKGLDMSSAISPNTLERKGLETEMDEDRDILIVNQHHLINTVT